MDPIIRSIEEDRRAGLQSDADGRVWFRQRHVRFTTIRFRAEDLLRGGWAGFTDPLPPLNWNPPPEAPEIRAFAAEASRRFLALWYRCIDVMVARSLFGRDRHIFQTPFFEGGLFADTGIADDQALSVVSPELHRKILSDYEEGRRARTALPVYFLSDYLEGVTDDIRAALAPLQSLWNEEDGRLDLLEEPGRLCAMLEARLQTPSPAGRLRDGLLQAMDRRLHLYLGSLDEHLREIPDGELRRLIHRQRTSGDFPLEMRDRRSLLAHLAGSSGTETEPVVNENDLRDVLDLVELPSLLERTLRRAFYFASRRLHESISGIRRPESSTSQERVKATGARLKQATDDLHHLIEDVESRRLLPRLDRLAAAWPGGKLPALSSAIDTAEEEAARDRPDISAPLPSSDSSRLLRQMADLPQHLSETDGRILGFYTDHSSDHSSDHFDSSLEKDERYPPATFPSRYNPARDGAEVLSTARHILADRLRVVRRTANDYSIRPGDRHGILTLNPVLRLWKDRPKYEKGLPPVASREINTPDVVQCLADLACLADPDLPRRELQAGEALREKHGRRGLAQLRFFLVPGSCFPVREIDKRDFPEFRQRVIGEKRTPAELGIEGEEGILTGGWYRKQTHTLYYPVGGDNALLLSILWKAGRVEGTAAFFFALGQFVHDCFEDRKIYYRLGETTFREIVEDYYRFYEKLRKTRDERSGRRRPDNSRAAVRFLFAVSYSRLLTEALTGSNQGAFRHRPTEDWFAKNTKIPLIARADRNELHALREKARSIIEGFWKEGSKEQTTAAES